MKKATAVRQPGQYEAAIRQLISQGRLGKGVELLVALSLDDAVALEPALVNYVMYNCMRRKDWARALAL
eukprot:30161-Eustigmatos_ZCMA.PRE.1